MSTALALCMLCSRRQLSRSVYVREWQTGGHRLIWSPAAAITSRRRHTPLTHIDSDCMGRAAASAAAVAADAGPSNGLSVDITRENFKQALPAIQEAINRCTFMAIDCEMTGLFTSTSGHDYLDDLQTRYLKTVHSSQAFVINQFGLATFEPAPGSGSSSNGCKGAVALPTAWVARTFNFYLIPCFDRAAGANKRFLSETASLAFLASQGFDFNKVIYHGVPFMPLCARDARLAQLAQDQQRNDGPSRAPVSVTDPADVEFVEGLRSAVREWLRGRPAEPELLLPPVPSGWRRLLAYQELAQHELYAEGQEGEGEERPEGEEEAAAAAAHAPRFWVNKVYGDNGGGPPRLSLRRVTGGASEVAQLEAELRAAQEAAIHDAAGFAAVFEMMQRSHKPLVGHNLWFDLSYAVAQFGDGAMPPGWEQYKQAVREQWLPGGVYDTKYIVRHVPEVLEACAGGSSLGELYQALACGGAAKQAQTLLQQGAVSAAAGTAAGAGAGGSSTPAQLPTIDHADGFDKYRNLAAGALAHEAGYDAFMTGAVFACLLPLVAAKAAAEPHVDEGAGPDIDGCSSPAAAGANACSSSSSSSEAARALAPVRHLMGRLNLTRSDIPYAALWGEDPLPERPHVFHLNGLEPGWRFGDIARAAQRAGLGKVRITALGSSSAAIEVDPEVAPQALQSLAGVGPWSVSTYAEYARRLVVDRTREPAPEAAAVAQRPAADAVVQQAQQQAQVGSKRSREEEDEQQEDGRQHRSKSCCIM